MEGARVDAWLWAIRLASTRSEATALCRGGHVKVNGAAAKPASPLKVGDRVAAYVHERHRDVEVVELLTKRVGAPVAATAYVDHSPPPPPREHVPGVFRSPASGRPTKKDRRSTDRLRGR
jgi:ribosome-associated heat shock protein Hsp15